MECPIPSALELMRTRFSLPGRTEDGDAVFWLEKETMLEKDAQFHVLRP